MSDLLGQLESALGGAYRFERELGGGGMSRVFLAKETALGRNVVIKVLPPELSAGLNIDRFRREIQLAASLQHPHIVPLLAAGQASDALPLLYYTMPLVDGESLRARLIREHELPIGEAVRLLRDVVDALACAHEHNVVHRDIKPDNVLVSRQHAMVTDFGVAKALESGSGEQRLGGALTSLGVALGTPAYMAPEQAAADPHTDYRADIYAVGALAYEMLTGRPPFIGPSPQAILAAQVMQAPPPITDLRATVPPAMAALVMRCLEKKPADRWQSAEELLHHLESMATPSSGTAPTGAVAAVLSSSTPVTPSVPLPIMSSRWHRAGYLVLGLVLALGAAWGVTRFRGSSAESAPAAGEAVVVLPFENLGRPEDAYFADGVTEEITNRLTGIGGLRVIARSSARQYKGTTKPIRQIGQELGVAYVLEGTVRWEKAGDSTSQVRVSPELIRVSDGTNVWAHGYEAVLSGVFQVQSDIAEQVAGAMNVALAAPEREALASRPTSNAEAYDLYLQGRDYLDRQYSGADLRTAVTLFERAIALDSSFALAYANLAQADDFLYWFYFDRTDRRRDMVQHAAERAVALQPTLPEAHLAMGYYYYHGQLDYARALAEVDLALKARPNDAALLLLQGFIERRQGKWEDALEHLLKAVELDPRSAGGQFEVSGTYAVLGRWSESARWIDRGIALAPADPRPYLQLVWHHLNVDGSKEQARQAFLRGIQAAGEGQLIRTITPLGLQEAILQTISQTDLPLLGNVTAESFEGDTARYYEWQAAIRGRQGARAAEQAFLDSARVRLETMIAARPREHVFHLRLGWVYANLGRREEAVREVRSATTLMPVSKDALDGSVVAYGAALLLAQVGERDAAIQALEEFMGRLHYPPVTAIWLKLSTTWAPIRSDPRFQRLVASAK
jgi:TolB-like protein/Flp pilus assembly protein TadD/tRNA A-37 threonylcarbamoyl transferase component Bud32